MYDAIQDLQEDAKDLAHHAKHKAEQVSSEVAGKVGEKVEEVKGKIHEADVYKRQVSYISIFLSIFFVICFNCPIFVVHNQNLLYFYEVYR